MTSTRAVTVTEASDPGTCPGSDPLIPDAQSGGGSIADIAGCVNAAASVLLLARLIGTVSHTGEHGDNGDTYNDEGGLSLRSRVVGNSGGVSIAGIQTHQNNRIG
jgi:hypothetical protein